MWGSEKNRPACIISEDRYYSDKLSAYAKQLGFADVYSGEKFELLWDHPHVADHALYFLDYNPNWDDDDCRSAMDMARKNRLPVIIALSFDMLDHCWAICDYDQCHFVIRDDWPEIMSLLAFLGLPAHAGVREGGENHNTQLMQISEQITVLAKKLAQLAQSSSASPSSDVRGSPYIAESSTSFRAAEQQNLAFPSQNAQSGSQISPEQFKKMLLLMQSLRHMRYDFLPASLFVEPAWNILLDIFGAYLTRKQVSVTSLCIASAVPTTTALRWIDTMIKADLLERRADRLDGRRVFIQLSDTGIAAMEGYFSRMMGMLPNKN